jgi:cell division septation protein DedD
MDKALKQRLVGASVLIILAVIVLPMLLGGRSDTLKQESQQIELPQKPEELSFAKRRFPVGVPEKAGSDKPQAAVDAGDSKPLKTVEPEPVPLDTEAQSPSQDIPEDNADTDPGLVVADSSANTVEETGSVAAGEVEKPPAVTAVLINPSANESDAAPLSDDKPSEQPRYLVQVASFSSEKRANVLADELRADDMTVIIDSVDRTAGRLHRVRVGPFAKRSEADAMVARIGTKNTGLSPRVMDTRPGDPAQVAKSSDPLVRWVVQVGSYSSATAADTHVAQLRLLGLPAFAEKVTSSAGTLYKVRIGPEIDGAKAKDLKDRIMAEHNIDGFVTTQE